MVLNCVRSTGGSRIHVVVICVFLWKLGEDDIFWSSLPNTKQCTIHARIAGATEIAAVETNSFDSENYVCSKTVVLHGAQW